MATPRVEKLLTGIDVGSSKIAVVIAGVTADGAIHSLGTGVRESLGIRRGYVVDVAAVDRSVREALEMAERVAGLEVQQAWVGFGGGSIASSIAYHEERFTRGQIESDDVDELHERAAARLIGDQRAVLHAEPMLYTLDGGDGVRDPVGLFADRFGVSVHLVEADRGPVSNLVTSVRAAHVDVREVVATMVAAGRSTLTAEQRDLGTVLVDIGASLTQVGLFVGGMLVGLATIPSGGGDITDDIASAFGARRSQAELLKCKFGSAISSPRDHQDQLPIDRDAEDEGRDSPKISRAQLNAVIRARLDHFVPQIGTLLKAMGDGGPTGRQLVLTGGGAEIKGIADYVQGVLGGSVRTIRPTGIIGQPSSHGGPEFSTAIGLVLHAASPPTDLRPRAGVGTTDDGAPWWARMAAMWQRGK
jgi:cell division protein FtsA